MAVGNVKLHDAPTPTQQRCPLTPGCPRPLPFVPASGSPELVEALLRSGADATAVTQLGLTPIHIAVTHGSTHLLPMLRLFGGDLEAEDRYGRTPVALWCERGWGTPAGVDDCAEQASFQVEQASVDADAEAHVDSRESAMCDFAVRPGNMQAVATLRDFLAAHRPVLLSGAVSGRAGASDDAQWQRMAQSLSRPRVLQRLGSNMPVVPNSTAGPTSPGKAGAEEALADYVHSQAGALGGATATEAAAPLDRSGDCPASRRQLDGCWYGGDDGDQVPTVPSNSSTTPRHVYHRLRGDEASELDGLWEVPAALDAVVTNVAVSAVAFTLSPTGGGQPFAVSPGHWSATVYVCVIADPDAAVRVCVLNRAAVCVWLSLCTQVRGARVLPAAAPDGGV